MYHKFVFLLFISFSSIVSGQDSTIVFSGKIVNGSKPIYNVSVKNVSNFTGTITDFSGDFKMNANKGDRFVFSCIGYKPIHYTIPDTLRTKSYRVLINMVVDTVYLEEAVVMPWPQNVTMLKKAMLAKKTEVEKIAPYAGFREIEGEVKEPEPTVLNPISFLVSKLGKKARQERKLKRYKAILEDKNFEKK